MGFGGMQGMITSLKNNKITKGERLDYFEKNKNSTNKISIKKSLNSKNASP